VIKHAAEFGGQETPEMLTANTSITKLHRYDDDNVNDMDQTNK